MEKDNEYCVVREGNDLILVPGKGMEEWRACTANRIRLVLLGGTEYAFCVRIVGHPQPPPHGPPHAGYRILLYPPGANGKKYAKITADYAFVGGPVHGGTAHSED